MAPRGSPGRNGWPRLSSEERRRVVLAAMRRPMHLLVLLAGFGMFVILSAAWLPPLALATYGALIFFSARDPSFQGRVLEGRKRPGLPDAGEEPSPDRRARWLPRGETREKVEAALEVQRQTITAVEESDEVTREVLSDAVPKLRALGDGLVDLAHRREKAGAEIRAQESRFPEEAPRPDLQALRNEVERADEELSGVVERLLALRSQVVRVSLQSGDPARESAHRLTRDLDDLNRRVEALGETREPPRG